MSLSFDPAEADLADPYGIYALYARYREREPVHRADDGTWYLFSHAAVAQVLSSRDYCRGPLPARIPEECPHLRRTVANWMVFMDPPEHTRVRALVARSFTSGAVGRLLPGISSLAEELAGALGDELVEHGEADLVEHFAAVLPVLVISELLGVPRADRAWFRGRALDLQQATSVRTGRASDAYARAEDAASQLDAYFRAELRLSGRRERDDLIGRMLRHGADDLSEDTLVGTCIHLLTAGHETTTNLLAKGMLALFAHPEQLALLRSRPDLLTAGAEELLRYDAPVQMITRYATAGARIDGRGRGRGHGHGHDVPDGTKVTLVLGSANRDPGYFQEPDLLDVRRDSARHVTFGAGAHYCVGAPLARAEARIGLRALLTRLPSLAIATRDPEPVRYAPDLVFHGPERLMVGLV